MAEKNEDRAAVEIDLDAQTFDLGSWVQDQHTYPEFTTAIRLNADAVAKANRALNKIKQIDKRLPDLRKAAEGSVGGGSLGTSTPEQAAYDKAVKERRALMAEHTEAKDKAKASELKLTFRSKGGSANKRAREQLEELLPGITSMSAEELGEKFQQNPDLAHRQQALLFLELISDIVNPQGQHVDVSSLDADKVVGLVSRLSASDTNRMSLNMNLAMGGVDLVEEEIDAGFLG